MSTEPIGRFWLYWLYAAAMCALLFGLSMLVLPSQAQVGFNLLLFGTTWHPPTFGPEAVGYIVFVCGILGAVMVGWAVLMLYVVSGPFRRGERGARDMLVASLAAWFVPDTAFSIGTGFWQNAVLNAIFLLAFAVPIAATWRRFPARR
jgi:hypothetical protein